MDVERFRSVAAVPATRSCRRGRRSFHFPSVLAVAPPLRSVVRPSIHVCPCTFYPRRTSPIEGEVSSIHTQFCSPISAHHVRDCIADMLGLPSSVRSGRSGFSHAARRDLPPPSLARRRTCSGSRQSRTIEIRQKKKRAKKKGTSITAAAAAKAAIARMCI